MLMEPGSRAEGGCAVETEFGREPCLGIVNAPIPGQEEHNANYLLEHGAALKAFDLPTLEFRVRSLLAHPEKLAEMAARARALGRPHAARQVLETVLYRCEHKSEEVYG